MSLESRPRSPASAPATPSRGLYRSSFTTEGLTDEERLWAVAAAGNAALATTPLTPQLDVRLDSYALGGAALGHARASPRRTERTTAMLSDGQDFVMLQLTLRGTASGDAEGRPIRTGPGDLIMLDATRTFALVDESDREGLSIAFARPVIAAIVPDPATLHGLVLGPERNGLLADYLRSLLPRLATLPNTAGRALSRVIVELLAVVLEHPLEENAIPAAAEEADTLDRERIAVLAWIDANLTDHDLDPAGVASALNLSRSRLYKLFETLGGVAGHIWKRRLAAVHQSLLNPDERRPIGELAYAWGFGSEAHFARAFRAAYGKSPGQIRREAQSTG